MAYMLPFLVCMLGRVGATDPLDGAAFVQLHQTVGKDDWNGTAGAQGMGSLAMRAAYRTAQFARQMRPYGVRVLQKAEKKGEKALIFGTEKHLEEMGKEYTKTGEINDKWTHPTWHVKEVAIYSVMHGRKGRGYQFGEKTMHKLNTPSPSVTIHEDPLDPYRELSLFVGNHSMTNYTPKFYFADVIGLITEQKTDHNNADISEAVLADISEAVLLSPQTEAMSPQTATNEYEPEFNLFWTMVYQAVAQQETSDEAIEFKTLDIITPLTNEIATIYTLKYFPEAAKIPDPDVFGCFWNTRLSVKTLQTDESGACERWFNKIDEDAKQIHREVLDLIKKMDEECEGPAVKS